MPIDDLQQAAQKIAGFINTLNKLGGMKLKFRITAGEGAKDPAGLEARQIYVELGGPDTPMLTQHNGELLRALETIAAQILRLDQREHDLVSFDAASFKAIRAQELKMQAEVAADKVIRSGVPFAFPPMNSRERRLLHMSSARLKAWKRRARAKDWIGFWRSIRLARLICLWQRRRGREALIGRRGAGTAGTTGGIGDGRASGPWSVNSGRLEIQFTVRSS